MSLGRCYEIFSSRPINPCQEILKNLGREEVEEDRVYFAALLWASHTVWDLEYTGHNWGQPLEVADMYFIQHGFHLDNTWIIFMLNNISMTA
jgi:hypothetical protein